MAIASNHDSNVVHWMGVEPTPVARLAPETSAYTNSATSARGDTIYFSEAKIECSFISFSFFDPRRNPWFS